MDVSKVFGLFGKCANTVAIFHNGQALMELKYTYLMCPNFCTHFVNMLTEFLASHRECDCTENMIQQSLCTKWYNIGATVALLDNGHFYGGLLISDIMQRNFSNVPTFYDQIWSKYFLQVSMNLHPVLPFSYIM